MIEKLPENKDKVFKTETGEYLTIPELSIPKPVSNKINELVDAVNELQEAFESIHPCLKYKDLNKRQDDPYAEQRKWIGKLCKVYDDNDFIHYAVLEKIFDNSNYCYGTQIGDYRHCEPVKPDDDIIYKGE